MVGEETRRENRPGPRRATRLTAALLGALILSLAVSIAASAAEEAKIKDEYEVGPPATPVTQPEGIVYDEASQAFYGASSGLTSPPDGTVYKATLDGEVETFMPSGFDGAGGVDGTRTETHGFNIDKQGRLYIGGVKTGFLHVYQLPAGGKIAEFNVTPVAGDPQTPYVNDVTISPKNGDVYFTDSQRSFIYRITENQVEAGGGTPQAIELEPEVDYTTPSTRTNNALEANGIRFTPDGEYVIFDSLNNGELYRLTPLKGSPNNDPLIEGNERKIVKIKGSSPERLGNIDGLEFKNRGTLYAVDNSGTMTETPGSFDDNPERVLELRLSDNYTKAKVLSVTTSPEFRSPTAASLIPGGRVLINNAEFFDADGPPFTILNIKRP